MSQEKVKEQVGFSRNELVAQIEGCISHHLKQSVSQGTPLHAALEYVMLSGGKRIRPLIALSLYSSFGGLNFDSFLKCALSLEILHTASLVHDDLPALDNDDLRRGQPTCHVKFDEATAILTADFMLPWATSLILESDFSAEIKNEISSVINSAFMKLCIGQNLDLLNDDKKQDLISIATFKTGALFEASFVIPFLALEADAKTLQIASETGLLFGTAFQVIDDYLDIYANPEIKGRMASSDSKNNKKTFFAKNDQQSSLELIEKSRQKISENLDLLSKNQGLNGELGIIESLVIDLFSQVSLKTVQS